MKRTHLVVPSILLAVGFATATTTFAKPENKGGHQKMNHGQTVSEVARNKNASDNKTHKTKKEKKFKAKTKAERVENANETRNRAIRQAQNSYESTRRSILQNDNDERLSRAERERLEQARRERNAAIRRAQEQYRLTIRNTY